MNDKLEILWNEDSTRDFLDDIKSFASSLDDYQIVWNPERVDDEKHIVIKNGKYRVSFEKSKESFKCPACENVTFEVMEGIFQTKPAVGLCCRKCDSYGVVFPRGM